MKLNGFGRHKDVDYHAAGPIAFLVLSLRCDLVKGIAATFDFRDDVVGGGIQMNGIEFQRLGLFGNGDAGEGSTSQAFVGEFLEPELDQVQPGARGSA
jgi:hypothetical protein